MNDSDSIMSNLVSAILDGDCAASVSQAHQLLDTGATSRQIVTDGIEPAMSALDSKCTLEQFNLLEIMLAGRAVTELMKVLYPAGSAAAPTRGAVVIAALEGDVHDLGKNILKMVLTGSGYRVVDCGKDCPVAEMVAAAEREHAFAVLASGLISPVIPLVRQLRGLLRERGLAQVAIVAGGAALKQCTAEALNVDYVARDAFDCAQFLEGLPR